MSHAEARVRPHGRRCHLRSLSIIYLLALIATPAAAAADDLFVGVFESETRENFGSDTPGEYRIEVIAKSKGEYSASIFQRGKLLEVKDLVPCPVESDDYLRSRGAGRAEVLCPRKSYGSFHGFLSYSENGINMVAVKAKYAEDPSLVKQEGLKPGDPSLFEGRHHKAQYYAHVSWFVYGFRKIKP
jgi:hypothetical protein